MLIAVWNRVPIPLNNLGQDELTLFASCQRDPLVRQHPARNPCWQREADRLVAVGNGVVRCLDTEAIQYPAKSLDLAILLEAEPNIPILRRLVVGSPRAVINRAISTHRN